MLPRQSIEYLYDAEAQNIEHRFLELCFLVAKKRNDSFGFSIAGQIELNGGGCIEQISPRLSSLLDLLFTPLRLQPFG